MDIIKSLKDYSLTPKEKIFTSYLKENISSYTCSEKITNPNYLREYFSPDDDFLIYSTGVADPNLILRKAI